jgi:hypothetical protein
MSALGQKPTFRSAIAMSALPRKRTLGGWWPCTLCAKSGHSRNNLRKQKDRHAAVSLAPAFAGRAVLRRNLSRKGCVVPPMSTRGARAARKNRQNNPGRTRGISEDEVKDVEELATPRTPVIYEVVRRLGQEEMERPLTCGGRESRQDFRSVSLC